MNLFPLQHLTDRLVAQRDVHLNVCRDSLEFLYSPAKAMADRFSASEMRVLADTYLRLPWCDLHQIEITERAVSCFEFPVSFLDHLAGRLESLALTGSDFGFRLPGRTQARRSQFAENLADQLRELPVDQGVALHVTLEAARALPGVALVYAFWWHPDVLLRLLAAPDYDWPKEAIQ